MNLIPPSLSFDPVVMDDAECAEQNENEIIFFSIFDFRVIVTNSSKIGEGGSKLRGGGEGGLHILSWEIPYASYSFEIERNIIVATFFFLIISQTEFRLAYNQNEIIRKHHILFNLKRDNKYILLSVC